MLLCHKTMIQVCSVKTQRNWEKNHHFYTIFVNHIKNEKEKEKRFEKRRFGSAEEKE